VHCQQHQPVLSRLLQAPGTTTDQPPSGPGTANDRVLGHCATSWFCIYPDRHRCQCCHSVRNFGSQVACCSGAPLGEDPTSVVHYHGVYGLRCVEVPSQLPRVLQWLLANAFVSSLACRVRLLLAKQYRTVCVHCRLQNELLTSPAWSSRHPECAAHCIHQHQIGGGHIPTATSFEGWHWWHHCQHATQCNRMPQQRHHKRCCLPPG
jgi:hypothetical protein